jgi:hypothetical protein
MTKRLIRPLVIVGFVCLATTGARATLINGDFSSAAEFGGGTTVIEWQDRDLGWFHGNQWALDSDERAETTTATNSRFGQVFANDQTGTNVELSFEWDALAGTGDERELRYWVFGWEQTDPGDPPEDDDSFLQLFGTNVFDPDGHVHTELLNGTAVDDQAGSKTFAVAIAHDVTDFDWIGVRFEAKGGLPGRWVDNVSFVVPEPSTCTLGSISLLGLAFGARRRKR